MKSVTVTIGRNIGSEPMTTDSWLDFVDETSFVLRGYLKEVWTEALYAGRWDAPEDSFIVYGPIRDDVYVNELRNELSILASRFSQEAIGLSVGESELVSP